MPQEKARASVGFLTATDPRDRKSWSGSHYLMYASLMKEFENVHLIGPIKKHYIIRMLNKTLNKVTRVIWKTRYNPQHNLITSLHYAWKIRRRIKRLRLNVIFAPAGSTEIAHLKTKIPICYLSDSSFRQIKNYYQHWYNNLSRLSNFESDYIEQKAISRASSLVYPSPWASEFVRHNYHTRNKSIHTISFGANIDNSPDINLSEKPYEGPIRILFMCTHWHRKGGDIVIQAFDQLTAKGHDIQLTIMGCDPPGKVFNSQVRIIPFLDKNSPEDRQHFETILKNNHLFFFPTRAECFGMVLSEACAYGLPTVTTDTGGVNVSIKHGHNGFVLPPEAHINDYVEHIEKFIFDRTLLKAMAIRAREHYEAELNWTVWASKMRNVLLDTARLPEA